MCRNINFWHFLWLVHNSPFEIYRRLKLCILLIYFCIIFMKASSSSMNEWFSLKKKKKRRCCEWFIFPFKTNNILQWFFWNENFLLESLNRTWFVVEFYSYVGHYAIHYVIVVQSSKVNFVQQRHKQVQCSSKKIVLQVMKI